MENTNLLDKDFKAKVINLLTDLQKNIQDLRENFIKEAEDLKKEPLRDEENKI